MLRCEYCAFAAKACEQCLEREEKRKEKAKLSAKKRKLWASARNEAMKSIGMKKTKWGWE